LACPDRRPPPIMNPFKPLRTRRAHREDRELRADLRAIRREFRALGSDLVEDLSDFNAPQRSAWPPGRTSRPATTRSRRRSSGRCSGNSC